MDKDLIERLAREAGIFNPRPLRFADNGDGTISLRSSQEPTPAELAIERFTALVAEECAQLAENTYEGTSGGCDGDSGFDFSGERSAEAIRRKFCTGQSGT